MLKKAESYKKGMVFSTLFNIVAKGLAFCTNILIAYYFGTSAKTDLYFYMVGFTTTIALFINGSTLSVIIPEAISIKLAQGVQSTHKFLNFFLYLFGSLTLIPSAALLFYPIATLKIFSKFNEPALNANVDLIALSCILIILMTINSYLKEVMGMFLFFTAPMIMSLINSLSCLIFIFFFHSKLSIISIMVGLIFGNLLNLILLLYFLHKKTGWSHHFNIIPKKHFKNIFYAQSGCLASTLSSLAPPYLLSGLSTGVISAINFSRQITEIPPSFITAQIASVSGIKFNTLFARNELSTLNEVFIKTFSFLIFILMPACGIIFIYSKEIVTLIFSRGAFDIAAIEDTSVFCKYFILAVPLIALDQLSTRVLIAAKKIPQTFWYQIGSNMLLIITIMLLLPYLHSIAFPVAILMNYLVNVLVQPILFHFICPFINYNELLKKLFQITLANGVVGTAVYYLGIFSGNLLTSPFFSIFTGTIIYIILILLINVFFKLNKDISILIKRTIFFRI